MKKTLLLISIPILIVLFYSMGVLITNRNENRIVKRYNLEYEYYLNKIIYGTELTTIINKATNQNEINEIQKDENNHYIENEKDSIKLEIKILSTGKTYPMEEFYNNDITRFVQNFNLVKFRCTSIEYHKKTGKVKELVFEEIEEIN